MYGETLRLAGARFAGLEDGDPEFFRMEPHFPSIKKRTDKQAENQDEKAKPTALHDPVRHETPYTLF
jgi:hypothetical protein